MIDRAYRNGPITVRCDACAHGCLDTETVVFAGAMATMKDEGWRTRRIGEDWVHFCPDCAVPETAGRGAL